MEVKDTKFDLLAEKYWNSVNGCENIEKKLGFSWDILIIWQKQAHCQGLVQFGKTTRCSNRYKPKAANMTIWIIRRKQLFLKVVVTIFLFHVKVAIINGLGDLDEKSQIIKRAGLMWQNVSDETTCFFYFHKKLRFMARIFWCFISIL